MKVEVLRAAPRLLGEAVHIQLALKGREAVVPEVLLHDAFEMLQKRSVVMVDVDVDVRAVHKKFDT